MLGFLRNSGKRLKIMQMDWLIKYPHFPWFIQYYSYFSYFSAFLFNISSNGPNILLKQSLSKYTNLTSFYF